MSSSLTSLIGVSVIAAIHLAAGRVHTVVPRSSAWFSAARGLSVAYVFVHLMPELSEMQALWLHAMPHRLAPWLETQVYLAALLGVLITLGFEAGASEKERTEPHAQAGRSFWAQAAPFAVYNVLLGAFSPNVGTASSTLLATLAFGSHFLLSDRALFVMNPRLYVRRCRWLLAGSILLGWAAATLWRIPELLVAALMALVAGTMIARVIKEELPERREGHFSAFVAGAILYSALLLALAYTQAGSEGASRARPSAAGPGAAPSGLVHWSAN